MTPSEARTIRAKAIAEANRKYREERRRIEQVKTQELAKASADYATNIASVPKQHTVELNQ